MFDSCEGAASVQTCSAAAVVGEPRLFLADGHP